MPTANETFASRKPGGNASLADELARQQATLAAMTSAQRVEKFGYSSFDVGDYVMAYDALGQARMRIGTQSDGTLGVLYANGDPPPKVSPPVLASRELTIAVYWDGTFADGKPRPGDVVRVDIHMSKAPAFTPDATTACGSMTAEGIELLSADSTTHYIKLVAVTSSDVIGPPSDERFALPLPAGSIASRVVGAEQLAVSIALASEIIVGRPTAGRIHIDGREGAQQGLRMYDAVGSETVTMDAETGAVTLRGALRTGDEGVRIVIPSRFETDQGTGQQAILFYPSSGDNYAGIISAPDIYGAIEMATGLGDTGFVSLTMYSTGAAWQWRSLTQGIVGGGFIIDEYRAQMAWNNTRGILFDNQGCAIQTDGNLTLGVYNPITGTYDGYFLWTAYNNSCFSSCSAATIGWVHTTNMTSNGAPTIGTIAIQTNSGNAVSLGARDFPLYGSLAEYKTAFTPMPFDSLQAIRNAPVSEFEYLPEYTASESEGVRYLGPMVDDLPPEIITVAEGVGTGISMRGLVAVLWDAVAKLDGRLDSLENPQEVTGDPSTTQDPGTA